MVSGVLMKQSMQPISIVVPTLNEADNIVLLCERIDSALGAARIPYEILIVDDHSVDGTADVAKSLSSTYNVKVLFKNGARGKAFSLLEGFAAAKYELVCMIDADLQYPPEAIAGMYHKLQFCNADIVISERIENQTSLLRRASSFVFKTLFTRLLFGINYDTQSGLKLFRKRVLDTVHLSPSPWTFDLEFIVRSLEQGYTIVSQPIQFAERNAGEAKVKMLSATAEIASGSYKLWRSSSSKDIKKSYKQSEGLQRVVATLGVAMIVALGAASFSTPRTSALELPLSTIPLVSVSLPAEEVQTTPNPLPTTSGPTAQKSDAAGTASTAPSVEVQPAASARNTTLQTQSLPRGVPASSAPSVKYYPQSSLDATRTHNLLRIAKIVGLVGVGLLTLVGVARGMKKIINGSRQQPLKV